MIITCNFVWYIHRYDCYTIQKSILLTKKSLGASKHLFCILRFFFFSCILLSPSILKKQNFPPLSKWKGRESTPKSFALVSAGASSVNNIISYKTGGTEKRPWALYTYNCFQSKSMAKLLLYAFSVCFLCCLWFSEKNFFCPLEEFFFVQTSKDPIIHLSLSFNLPISSKAHFSCFSSRTLVFSSFSLLSAYSSASSFYHGDFALFWKILMAIHSIWCSMGL